LSYYNQALVGRLRCQLRRHKHRRRGCIATIHNARVTVLGCFGGDYVIVSVCMFLWVSGSRTSA